MEVSEIYKFMHVYIYTDVIRMNFILTVLFLSRDLLITVRSAEELSVGAGLCRMSTELLILLTLLLL